MLDVTHNDSKADQEAVPVDGRGAGQIVTNNALGKYWAHKIGANG